MPLFRRLSRYRSGKANDLRADAKKKLKKVKADDVMKRAGVLRLDGTPKKATIRVQGGVSVRNASEEGYDYRVRTLDFANSDVPFTAEEAGELAAASPTTITHASSHCWSVTRRWTTPRTRDSTSTAMNSGSTSTRSSPSTSTGTNLAVDSIGGEESTVHPFSGLTMQRTHSVRNECQTPFAALTPLVSAYLR